DVRAVVLHFFQQRDQLRARRRCAGHLGGQRAVLSDAGEEKLRHLLLVLQERLLLALGDLEQGRLRDVNEALVDQSGHVPEEKGQKQRAYVTSVNISVRHNNDAVIAGLRAIEVLGDARSERRDERSDLGGSEHPVEPRLLDVQDLAAQRQDRLEAPVPSLLGAAAGRVSFDDEDLREGGVLLLAVGELARERARVEGPLAADELAGLARGLAGAGRLDDLLDDLSRDPRIFLEV